MEDKVDPKIKMRVSGYFETTISLPIEQAEEKAQQWKNVMKLKQGYSTSILSLNELSKLEHTDDIVKLTDMIIT
jgi:hypothetical protein